MSRPRRPRLRPGMLLALPVALLLPAAFPAAAQPSPLDCDGPAPEAEPGTAEWLLRDATNLFCAQQRHLDKALHTVITTPPENALADGYRRPALHDGRRFRFARATVTSRSGAALALEIYRPCAPGTCDNRPDALRSFAPPYPAVIVVHGGASRKELHWWASQPLAEAGYFVVALDTANSTSGHRPDTEDVLDWLTATPAAPTARGEFNPHWDELQRERIGIAGHSAGGVVAGRLGQEDERISALVSWDRAQSSPLPDDLPLRTPAMFQFADWNCQQVPVCQPEPYLEPPNPDGPGNKGDDFARAREAGVDTMQIALRAATHLDWVPSKLAGNRYAEIVSLYYTLAWFDRYLKGADDPAAAADAFARLTAPAFDDSADIHNISQGFYDPLAALAAGDPLAGNIPYGLAGMPVADRLSFYFRSKCDIAAPGAAMRATSDDIRTEGCVGGDSALSPQTGGGGGGCTIGGGRDHGLPLLLLIALAGYLLRSGSRAKTGRR